MLETEPTRYRKVIKKSILIDANVITVDTLANVTLIAPITGYIEGQNGSELFSIPGTYDDFSYSVSYVKDTGEIKLYANHTSISEKELMLVIYYEKNEES